MSEPQKLPPEKGRMLPGIAGICLYMLVVALAGAMGVYQGYWQGAIAKFAILPICTIVVLGAFGLLKMKRWGWAIVLAGTLMLSLGYVLMARLNRDGRLLVMAGLALCFFLYLVRPEVRDRMM